FEFVAQPYTAAIVLGRIARGDSGTGTRRQGGLRLQPLRQVNLNLHLRAAGKILPGAHIDIAGDILACLHGRLRFRARTATSCTADRKPVETQLLAQSAERIEAGSETAECGDGLCDLGQLQRRQLLCTLTEE